LTAVAPTIMPRTQQTTKRPASGCRTVKVPSEAGLRSVTRWKCSKSKFASYRNRKPLSRAPMKSFNARTSTGRTFLPSSSSRRLFQLASHSLALHIVPLQLVASKCSLTSPDLISHIQRLRVVAMSCRTPHSRWRAIRAPRGRRGQTAWSSVPCSNSIEVSSSRRIPPSMALTKRLSHKVTCHDKATRPM